MIKQEQREMKVHNFFSDEFEDLPCEFELHLDSKHKLDGVNLTSVISKGLIEIFSRLTDDEVDTIEQDFKEWWMENENG